MQSRPVYHGQSSTQGRGRRRRRRRRKRENNEFKRNSITRRTMCTSTYTSFEESHPRDVGDLSCAPPLVPLSLSQSRSDESRAGMPQRAASSLEEFRRLSVLHMTYIKYMGLWALDRDSSAFSKCLYYVYNKLMLTIMICFGATVLADIFVNSNDLSAISDGGSMLGGIAIVIYKMIIVQLRRERIERLLRETVESCHQLCKFSTGVEHEIVDWYLLFCRTIFYGFIILAFILITALLFFVPVENGQLPIRARYPVDTTQPPWHEFGYFVEICTISVGIICLVGIDSLISNFCNLFLVQLGILDMHFRNCDGDRRRAIDSHDNADTNGDVRREIFARSVTVSRKKNDYECSDEIRDRRRFAERFARIVRGHQRLLVIIDDFNGVFSSSMFAQMLVSTTVICLCIFQTVLVKDDGLSSYKYPVYLAGAISQLFYVCWLGNEVMHQSACLPQSQWMSKWSDVISADTGRLLIPSMIFAKRTVNVRASVFFVLSMETFMAIMRSAYSFFAVLSAMQSETDQ